MNVPAEIVRELESAFGPATALQQVGGGCMAHASRMTTEQGVFFLKWSTNAALIESFACEASGLGMLAAAQEGPAVPEVVLHKSSATGGCLVLEWIESSEPGEGFFERFGRQLAQLHASRETRYGASADNFIGANPQPNEWMDNWLDFFRLRRLEPQAQQAQKSNRWPAAWKKPWARLLNRLGDILPAQPVASLLHGDLWSGNFMAGPGGKPYIFDPAVYYGHRETDLAMTAMFGGFGPAFYQAYQDAWPLEPGYEERKEIYNLYHYLNHLNLFGASYAGAVQRSIYRFGV